MAVSLVKEHPNIDKYFVGTNQIIHKYEIINVLGTGAYSTVFGATKKNSNVKYALKKVRTKYSEFAEHEIRILSKLKHSNIVRLLDSFTDEGIMVMVFNKYTMNLFQYMKKQLYISHYNTCLFGIKILQGLEYLKKNNIIHRDLKPENIFINDKDLVIGDFGMSVDKTKKIFMKFNVQTVFYRAPEIFLKADYNESLDMWSLGCIVYELYFKEPLFMKLDANDLFIEHNKILGPPKKDFIERHSIITGLYDDIENPSFITLGNQKHIIHVGINTRKGMRNWKLYDFVLNCCVWEPHERLSPTIAIKQLKTLQKNDI